MKTKTRHVINKLKELNFTFDKIFNSQYLRALETAQIEFLQGIWESVEVKEELTPNNSFSLQKNLSEKIYL